MQFTDTPPAPGTRQPQLASPALLIAALVATALSSHLPSTVAEAPVVDAVTGGRNPVIDAVTDVEGARGLRHHIFVPSFDSTSALLAPPEPWVEAYTKQILETKGRLSFRSNSIVENMFSHPVQYARKIYLERLAQFVTGWMPQSELSLAPAIGAGPLRAGTFNEKKRGVGEDWPLFGWTMTGSARIASVNKLLEDCIRQAVPGDVLEAGVWRGGMSAYIRGVLRAHGATNRASWLCDSFSGLPPTTSDIMGVEGGRHWDNTPYLEVSTKEVAEHIVLSGVADKNIIFAKGFFNDTMPPIRKMLNARAKDTKFAIMRLDGDMYKSTVDVMYNLYDRLSVGGYLIMDDWNGFESKTACTDFFAAHNHHPAVIQVDRSSAYWQKHEEVEVQYWRYEQHNFK